MKNNHIKLKNGFSILSVIILITIAISAIGVWWFSGNNNSSKLIGNKENIYATSLINDSAEFKLIFDQLVINGANASSIVFVPNTPSTATEPNILDPIYDGNNKKPHKKALRTNMSVTAPEGIWVYNKVGFRGNRIGETIVGTSGKPDTIVLVTGISDEVCASVNNILYGSPLIPKFTGSSVSSFFVTGATVAAPTTTSNTDFHFIPATYQWSVGCVSGEYGGHQNMFFRVLKAY